MTNTQNHDPSAHQLSYVGLRIGMDLKDGVTRLEHVSGHSWTTKGALWYIGHPTSPWRHEDEPSHLSIVTLEANSILEELLTHRPNTAARASFVLEGGLRGHGMEPMF